jgi:fused signal recognition particle receptor
VLLSTTDSRGEDTLADNTEKIQAGVEKTRRGWLGRLGDLLGIWVITDEFWDELEELLIRADVGTNTSSKLIERLKKRVINENVAYPEQVRDLLKTETIAILRESQQEGAVDESTSPHVILVVGVNGTGKTTSIAKLAHKHKLEGKKVLLAAADTFRAAAIEQLQVWGDELDVDVIAHQPGSDPGAVTFDAIQAALARGADVVIIDTAGRLHTKYNLMEELKKIQRAAGKVISKAPHEVLLVLDATTGQNGLSQARRFTEAVGVTGIVLAKLDGTAKGGIVIAVADELGTPLRYVGTGEDLDDIAVFEPEAFAEALFS